MSGKTGLIFDTYHPLEKALNTGDVILKNVVIITQSQARYDAAKKKYEYTNDINISFEYEDIAWSFSYINGAIKDDSYMWDFQEIDYHKYKQFYNTEQAKINARYQEQHPLGQKTLKEILEKGLQLIKKEKERE